MKAKIKVLRAGTFASVQDQGRFSLAQYGVQKGGFVDKRKAQKLNSILGNDSNCAVLEWTQLGPKFQFNQATEIAISETNSSTHLNEVGIRAQKTIRGAKYSILCNTDCFLCAYAYFVQVLSLIHI